MWYSWCCFFSYWCFFFLFPYCTGTSQHVRLAQQQATMPPFAPSRPPCFRTVRPCQKPCLLWRAGTSNTMTTTTTTTAVPQVASPDVDANGFPHMYVLFSAVVDVGVKSNTHLVLTIHRHICFLFVLGGGCTMTIALLLATMCCCNHPFIGVLFLLVLLLRYNGGAPSCYLVCWWIYCCWVGLTDSCCVHQELIVCCHVHDDCDDAIIVMNNLLRVEFGGTNNEYLGTIIFIIVHHLICFDLFDGGSVCCGDWIKLIFWIIFFYINHQ